MARLARLAVAGHLHLVLQRGHGRAAVFIDAADRRDYLAALEQATREHGVAVHAYGLPPDEVRLLVTPAEAAALGQAMQAVNRRFVRAHHRRHGGRGTLWDGRFASTVIDPARHGLACLRWIDGSAAMAEGAAGQDAWLSSAPHHIGAARVGWLSEHPVYWQLGNTPFEREARYREWLAQGLAAEDATHLRQAALGGWPLGTPAFAAALASRHARPMAPRPRGRPRRQPAPA